MGEACKICGSPAKIFEYAGQEAFNLNCPRCGLFHLSKDALIKFERSDNPEKIISVSYWIRQHQAESGLPIVIDLKIMRTILETPFVSPKPIEQANNLILWMGNTLKTPDQNTHIDVIDLTSIIGAYNERGVIYIAGYLLKEGFISNDEMRKGIVPKTYRSNLTFKGWEKYDELKRTSKESRLAFMAMQYDNELLDRIFNEVIIPAVKETGFDVRKLDQEKRAGSIDDKLRVEIRRSKFLIADLSNENRGAYWEAGYAEGLGMQVIYICEKDKFDRLSTHFDTNHHLTVKWKDDPDSLKKFAEELKATIRATFPAEAKMED